MKVVVFFETANLYVLDKLNKSVSHLVVGSSSIPPVSQISHEFLSPLKNIDYDVIVLAIQFNRALQRILIALSESGIEKPVYILRHYTLSEKLPFMEKEQFLHNRVDYLESAKLGGGVFSSYRNSHM